MNKPVIELNRFLYLCGAGTRRWSHYFYQKPNMYRIDSFYSHTYSSILEYKSKIDQQESFYENDSRGLSMNLPYTQLDNGNIYDKLYYYSFLEFEWDYIQNQFYDTVLNNKYFDFWGADTEYRPTREIFGGNHWRLDIKVTIDGIKKHKEISGYEAYPEGFAFFETILNDFNDKAELVPITQNIKNPNANEDKREKSLIKRLFNIIFNK